jgi:hypothetical protein
MPIFTSEADVTLTPYAPDELTVNPGEAVPPIVKDPSIAEVETLLSLT